MYLNKVILIGNITRDPELKSLPSGIKTCTFSLATNRVWKDKNGARQESVDYHNIVVFGNQAESVAQYMKKGSSILVQGRIQTRSWDDKTTGEKKYRTEIIAEMTQFGPKTSGGGGNGENGSPGEERAGKAPKQATGGQQGPVSMSDEIEYPENDLGPIPF